MSSNLCIACKIDMGEMNPRQYCGKWKCDNEDDVDRSEDSLSSLNVNGSGLELLELQAQLECLYQNKIDIIGLIDTLELKVIQCQAEMLPK